MTQRLSEIMALSCSQKVTLQQHQGMLASLELILLAACIPAPWRPPFFLDAAAHCDYRRTKLARIFLTSAGCH